MTASSLCIPKVDVNISKDFIYKTLSNLRVGHIKNITEIPLRNDPKYKRIIIKLFWNDNEQRIQDIKKNLCELGSIKVVYDMPWYWKLVIFHPQI
jgi:hypothetical protein